LAKLREEKGIQSKVLDEQPPIFSDVMWLWEAFVFLSGRRSYGMNGPLAISTLDMKAYVDLKGIKREDDLDLMLHTIPLLDDLWMADWYKRQEVRRTQRSK
jgi:hypothetical protein